MVYVDKVVKKGIEYPIKDGYDKTVRLQVNDGIVQMSDMSYQTVILEGDATIYFPDEMADRKVTLAIFNNTTTDLTVNFSFSEEKEYLHKRKIEPEFTIINIYSVGYRFLLDAVEGILKDETEEGTA